MRPFSGSGRKISGFRDLGLDFRGGIRIFSVSSVFVKEFLARTTMIEVRNNRVRTETIEADK
jgi:hypothetical protein